MHYRLGELQTEVELLRSLLYRATGKLIILFIARIYRKGSIKPPGGGVNFEPSTGRLSREGAY